jgi:putative hydrolase of the HAD superfamily
MGDGFGTEANCHGKEHGISGRVQRNVKVKAVLFDFGGVVAEEGFLEGLRAIGRRFGLSPGEFSRMADELIMSSGYVTGRISESAYWEAVRERAGIAAPDGELRAEILGRFVLRPDVLDCVRKARDAGCFTALLSDQTNWLDEIDVRTPFLHVFDFVFNSYIMKKSKQDPTVFADVCAAMGVAPEEALFVDDRPANLERARSAGLETVLVTDSESIRQELEERLAL